MFQLSWLEGLAPANGFAASATLIAARRLLAGLLIAWVATALPALGREPEPTEKAALAKAVDDFNAAMKAADFDAVLDFMPPKVLQLFVKKSGGEVAAFRKAIAAQMTEGLKVVKLESFGMNAAEAEWKALADGTPFAFLPTETIIRLPEPRNDRIRAKSKTLAMLDGGKWYLARVEEPLQLTMLRDAYPEFAGIEMPGGTMEVLKP